LHTQQWEISIFQPNSKPKESISFAIAYKMTEARFFKIDGFDSSVGQLGGYTSSLHALRRAFLR
jgi:hypothetical protein